MSDSKVRTRTCIPGDKPYRLQAHRHRGRVWGSPHAASTAASVVPPPAPADGIELLGPFQGSGMVDPPWLVRRADGTVVQLSHLLYLVLSSLDGRRNLDAVAEEVSAEFGRRVSSANVEYLIGNKLVGLQLIAGTASGHSNGAAKRSLFLKRRALSPALVGKLIRPLVPLFNPVVVGFVLGVLCAFDAWIFTHSITAHLLAVFTDPVRMLSVLGLIMLSMLFHELGHAAACRYGGARPAGIGIGFYLVWLTFYTDVTDTYRLDRRGRLRTDLGGLYFNAVAALILGAAYGITDNSIFLVAALLEQYAALMQVFPFIRTDGYHVLSDATGVPDISTRIRPVLRSILPGATPDPRVTELRPGVRRAVVAWVLVSVGLMGAVLAMMAINGPAIVGTTRSAVGFELDQLILAVRSGLWARVALGAVSVFIMMAPFIGLGLSLTVLSRSLARRLWRRLVGRTPVTSPA